MKDQKVDEYINKQKSPHNEILKKLRKIFLTALKNPDEQMQWGVITFRGGKFYLAALKERVHIGFAITGLDKSEVSLFEGSGKTMKHIKIYSLGDIDEKALIKLIKLVDKKAVCAECKKLK